MARLFTEQFSFSKGDSVVVIGLGRFGGAVAQSLMQLGHDVMGIDREAEPVHEWADLLTHAVQADSTNTMTMRQLGVADFAHAIVGIGTDLAASLMTVMALTELEIPDIWVKAMTPEHGQIAQRIGHFAMAVFGGNVGDMRLAQQRIDGGEFAIFGLYVEIRQGRHGPSYLSTMKRADSSAGPVLSLWAKRDSNP